MNYTPIIKALRAQAEAIDQAIAHLESLKSLNSPDSAKAREKRGRKSMSPEEAQRVSERMKRYWATRRTQRK